MSRYMHHLHFCRFSLSNIVILLINVINYNKSTFVSEYLSFVKS